jgi:nucleoside-diphosphate-sugar epimerase
LAEALRGLDGPPGLASAAKAEQELGWQPQGVEDGLRATVDWLKAEARAEAAALAAARAAAEHQRDA